MLIQADGVTHKAWALRDPASGDISAAELCEDKESVIRLAAARRDQQPHERRQYPVQVLITVTELAG